MTTPFMSGKLLMFAKLSLKSFIYDLSEIFCFPSKEIINIYKKYLIQKVQVFHIPTDIDRTALEFIFISDLNSDVLEEKFRDPIFEFIIASKLYKRFDASQILGLFWVEKESRKKKLGYYKIENIDNPCVCNPRL